MPVVVSHRMWTVSFAAISATRSRIECAQCNEGVRLLPRRKKVACQMAAAKMLPTLLHTANHSVWIRKEGLPPAHVIPVQCFRRAQMAAFMKVCVNAEAFEGLGWKWLCCNWLGEDARSFRME